MPTNSAASPTGHNLVSVDKKTETKRIISRITGLPIRGSWVPLPVDFWERCSKVGEGYSLDLAIVLGDVLTHVNPKGAVWVYRAELAASSGLEPRTINKLISRLVADGFISPDRGATFNSSKGEKFIAHQKFKEAFLGRPDRDDLGAPVETVEDDETDADESRTGEMTTWVALQPGDIALLFSGLKTRLKVRAAIELLRHYSGPTHNRLSRVDVAAVARRACGNRGLAAGDQTDHRAGPQGSPARPEGTDLRHRASLVALFENEAQ